MLVLSRRIGESIEIGDGITVKVVRLSGSRVRLAIDAPAGVDVWRSELAAKRSERVTLDASKPTGLTPASTHTELGWPSEPVVS